MPLPSDFMAHVRYTHTTTGEHWDWTGRRAFNRPDRAPRYRNENAARFAYEVNVATLEPSTPYVRQTCDFPHCLNPEHLEPVAELEGRKKTATPAGHADALGRIEEKLDRVLAMLEAMEEQARQVDMPHMPGVGLFLKQGPK